jgi:hypothetical protein
LENVEIGESVDGYKPTAWIINQPQFEIAKLAEAS